MGRSVSCAEGSILKAYYDISYMLDDEEGYLWEDFIYILKHKLKHKYHSLIECDEWLDNEDHAILENNKAYFGVSKYCDLVCLWVTPKEDENYNTEFNESWIYSIEKGFNKSFGELNKIGNFSNGEAVFKLKEGDINVNRQ